MWQGLPCPEPLSKFGHGQFVLPAKWWGDRGNLAEIEKRQGELEVYLTALRDWGAGLERDTVLWDRVRLTGPVKHFLCQPNATGHPTGGANVSSQMFGDGDGGSAAAPQPTPAPAPEPAPAPAPAPDRGPATQRGPAPAAADGAAQADESDERAESPTSASVRQYVEAANAAPTTPQRPAALAALSARQQQ